MEISVITGVEDPAIEPYIEDNPQPQNQSRWQQFLPTRRKCYLTATQFLVLLLMYGSLWGIMRKKALPGSEVFAICLLAVSAHIGGKITGFIKLPPLLGMLIVGFMFRNISSIPFYRDIHYKRAAILRNIALVIILLRAGLGLCPDTLRRLKLVVFRLSFIPCLIEATTCAISTHFFLDLPWVWAFMLGFVISAVSPAIIVPSMLNLIEKRLGTRKGIPTLVIAASSVDDIIAITGFGVCIGIAFSKGSLVWTLVKGPLEVLVGLTYGAVLGIIIWQLPHGENTKLTYYRVLMLFFGGLSVMFISMSLDFAGSGALGCLGLSFVAAMQWRKDVENFRKICLTTASMWHLIQPFLFSLIGAEVSVEDIKQDVGYGLLCLLLGIVVRCIITPIVTFGADLNLKERLFISAAWLPKATVQAAIGSVALDLARLSHSSPEIQGYGRKVLTLAVLAILLTAPVGALLIALLAPVLLTEEAKPKPAPEIEQEFEQKFEQSTQVRKQLPDYGSCNPFQPNEAFEKKEEV